MIVTLIYDCTKDKKLREELGRLQNEINLPVLVITEMQYAAKKHLKEAKTLMNKYAASEPFVLIEHGEVVRAVYKEEYSNIKQFTDKFVNKIKEVRLLSENK